MRYIILGLVLVGTAWSCVEGEYGCNLGNFPSYEQSTILGE